MSKRFQPDFAKADGLITVVTLDAATGEVLMVAYANEAAYEATLATGEMHYWSRSRGELWHKGATSGSIQRVVELRVDCDGDALLARVEQAGPACHEGYHSCFFRSLDADGAAHVVAERDKTPEELYGRASS